jgi:hypothetical protein
VVIIFVDVAATAQLFMRVDEMRRREYQNQDVPASPPEHGPGPDHDKPFDPFEVDGVHK